MTAKGSSINNICKAGETGADTRGDHAQWGRSHKNLVHVLLCLKYKLSQTGDNMFGLIIIS